MSEQLEEVRRAARRRRRAERSYAAAIRSAVLELEQAGARDAFAQVAAAAGISRQAVRQFIARSRI